MNEIMFVIIIIMWLFVGILGGLRCQENRVNYEMIIFVLFALFIPLIAKACGLL